MSNYNDIEIGSFSSLEMKITAELIQKFAKVTGDKNPIHLDEKYAEGTIFGKRIAHGMLISSFISSVLANQLPGPGTIYLGQTINFKVPVYIDDIILTKVIVIKKRDDKKIITLETICTNQDDKIVIDGIATVLFNK